MSTEKILIVEDDPHLLQFVEDALKIADYEVRSAGDGEEALAILARWRPHVILLDLNMPRKDGGEVLAELKSDDNLKQIPVVVLTTSEAQEDVLHAYGLHANCYITKPVDLEQFIQVVRSIDDFWLTVVRLPPKPEVS